MSNTKTPYLVTVGTTATAVIDPGTQGGVNIKARILRNNSGVDIYLGGPDVTASTTRGWKLAAATDFPDSISNGPIWAIVAASTAELQVWEVVY